MLTTVPVGILFPSGFCSPISYVCGRLLDLSNSAEGYLRTTDLYISIDFLSSGCPIHSSFSITRLQSRQVGSVALLAYHTLISPFRFLPGNPLCLRSSRPANSLRNHSQKCVSKSATSMPVAASKFNGHHVQTAERGDAEALPRKRLPMVRAALVMEAGKFSSCDGPGTD